MFQFELKSVFKPTGDQPEAISQLTAGVLRNDKYQTLHGATGTGKTFTMANVIQNVQRPTLVLAHNKTLAAQLYGEFQQFFPNNRVEYFLSSFDYFIPESYNPTTNRYIEKDSIINDQIERYRLSTIKSLMSNRRDVIVVSTVSCIFGAGNPKYFKESILPVRIGDKINRVEFLKQLVHIGYSRFNDEFTFGKIRIIGETIDIHDMLTNTAYRILLDFDKVERLFIINAESGKTIETPSVMRIYPARIYNTNQDNTDRVISEMIRDKNKEVEDFTLRNMPDEAKRLKTRTEFDIEMLQQLGWCSGIENYSRYIDDRERGMRPRCLLDFFPEDYLMFIDESHAMIPQIHAMFAGNNHMKQTLVDYGWRLAAALDNRPLKFQEFEDMQNQVIFVSATPAKYELQKCEGVVVEQIIRPTGLLDPCVEVHPCKNQIDDLLEHIDETIKSKNRVLITTLTKKMSESLAKKMSEWGIKASYLHSEIKPIDRMQILRQLRLGEIDVLIGVNLLREGLDLPEVGLVAIMDADKEGFLRSEQSMVQTIGRAARNIDGRVIMYGDKITKSMQRAIDETNRRRKIQEEYNTKHNITPYGVKKTTNDVLMQTTLAKKSKPNLIKEQIESFKVHMDPILLQMSKKDLDFQIKNMKKEMLQFAKDLDFLNAAKLRDTIKILETERDKKQD